MHKLVTHEYFMDEMTIMDIPIMMKYIKYADTTSWEQTRELMLSIVAPYLKKKDTTAKDIIKLPIDEDDKVEHDHTVSKGAMDWFKKYKENYNKEKQKES